MQIGVAEQARVLPSVPGGQVSWGHLAANGSFALVLPASGGAGSRPLVATLTLNLDQHGPSGLEGAVDGEYLSDGLHTSRSILRAIVEANR